MKIHEYQAKELFRKYSIPVPSGGVASSVDEALKVGETLSSYPLVVKAQIHAGGRGKGGGVKLVENAGLEGSIIVEKVKSEKATSGFDVDQGKMVDMIQAGIIDPTKVTRNALENATSISSLLITTECVVADKPEKEDKTPPMPPAGPYGGGY